MSDIATRLGVSPAEVIAHTDLNPDAAMQGVIEDAPPPRMSRRRAATAPSSPASGSSC